MIRTFFLLFLFLQLANSAMLRVPEDHALIQAALSASQSGDTVLVGPGVWVENLVVPQHDLTLASRWLLTGDSLDMAGTVLDGGGVGTVVRVPAGNHGIRIAGFRVENGWAWSETEEQVSGGIYVLNVNKITLDHLVLQHNRGNRYGIAASSMLWFMQGGSPDTVICDHLYVLANEDIGPQEYESYRWRVDLQADSLFVAKDVYVRDSSNTGGVYLSAGYGRLVGRNLIADGYRGCTAAIGSHARIVDVQDIVVRNCHQQAENYFGLFGMGAFDSLYASNVLIENNECTSLGDDNAGDIFGFNADYLVVDSLTVRYNRCTSGYAAGIIEADSTGMIRNLVVEGNEAGGLGDGVPGSEQGKIMKVVGCSMEDFRFVDNLSYIPSTGTNYFIDNLVLNWVGSRAPAEIAVLNPFSIRRGLFERNRQIFRGPANSYEGRILRAMLPDYRELTIEDCVFLDNTMHPSHAGDLDRGTLWIGGQDSTQITLRRVYMDGNSSGGIVSTDWRSSYTLEDVIVRKAEYRAIVLSSFYNYRHTTLTNVWVDSLDTHGWCPGPDYGWCMVGGVIVSTDDFDGETISNLSMTGCDSPYLVGAPPAGLNPPPSSKYINCCFFNNVFDNFIGWHGSAGSVRIPEFYNC